MRVKFTYWFYKKKKKLKKKCSTYLYNLSKIIVELPRDLERPLHYREKEDVSSSLH